MIEESEKEFLEKFPPYDLDELTKDDILSDTVMNYLVSLESSSMKVKRVEEAKEKAREFKVLTAFNNIYKAKEKEIGIDAYNFYNNSGLEFPGMEGIVYKTERYQLDENGCIYELIPKLNSRVLVCGHPILPVKIYRNLEDKTEKVKLAYFLRNEWETVIVDRSIISSNQAIVKLSDLGIRVTSENSKFLVKYLSEIERMNEDKVNKDISVSRLGWAKDVLIPYSDKYEFDNEKDMPRVNEKFGEKGTLEDWVDFFRERRKFNCISRIIMASSVVSIVLKQVQQSGFTLHIWGESGYGKTVACMVGESIFGNPSQSDGNGIGINFNFTTVGLEYRLNLYNNIPLFVNEMQHQKDAKDYDKMLFLVSEGKGRARGTKTGGVGKENSWNNVVITNGEKNIIKDNSNAGAYNRCLSCEIAEPSFEDLGDVADFVKNNYGTAIREILKHLNEFNCRELFDEIKKTLKNQDITEKQRIVEALVLLGDKLLTDIIFKDGYYLKPEDFENKTIKQKDVVVEERAYEVVKDWYISEKRHFLMEDAEDVSNQDIKVEIYGREMKFGFLAIIPSILRKVLNENGYDFNEVLNAWKRKGYLKHEKERNTLTVKLNDARVKCVTLDMCKDVGPLEEDENDDYLPF